MRSRGTTQFGSLAALLFPKPAAMVAGLTRGLRPKLLIQGCAADPHGLNILPGGSRGNFGSFPQSASCSLSSRLPGSFQPRTFLCRGLSYSSSANYQPKMGSVKHVDDQSR